MQSKELVYDAANFNTIQRVLGKRPGDYRIDPFYLRKGMADKPYFWDDERRKWVGVRIGDKFFLNEDGYAVREPA